MKIRAIASLSLSALMFGGTMVGCAQDGIGLASASSRNDSAAGKQAADNADRARKALGKGQAAEAVSFAEAAVAMEPRDAGYRALLGQSYLKAGRFASAEAAYGDVLTLSPDDSRAALNLALAQVAGGHWDAARRTLDAHASRIDPADLGLAMALAGNPETGVEVLTAATRRQDASPKTRQNLALALALSGRWMEARTMAGMDLPPTEADQRILQWMEFARPDHAADQVAALLGVTPANDPGQPVALALNAAPAQPAVALAKAEAPEAAPQPPVVTAAVEPQPVPAARPANLAAFSAPAVRFAPAREVVQALPAPRTVAPLIRTEGEFRRAVAFMREPKGDWYVQIGAFSSVGVAKDAWSRAQRRFVAFNGKIPAGVTFRNGERDLYRLSIGGFTRADADATCRAYRGRGGVCFVRAGAGDQIAQWAKKSGTQLAAR